jgi:transposase
MEKSPTRKSPTRKSPTNEEKLDNIRIEEIMNDLLKKYRYLNPYPKKEDLFQFLLFVQEQKNFKNWKSFWKPLLESYFLNYVAWRTKLEDYSLYI